MEIIIGITSVRELAPQAFRNRCVRGRIAKEGTGDIPFGCTVLEEVEGTRGSPEFLRVVDVLMASEWSRIYAFVNYTAVGYQFIERFIIM